MPFGIERTQVLRGQAGIEVNISEGWPLSGWYIKTGTQDDIDTALADYSYLTDWENGEPERE